MPEFFCEFDCIYTFAKLRELQSTDGRSALQYTAGDASKLLSFTPMLNGLELYQPVSNVSQPNLPIQSKVSGRVCILPSLLKYLIDRNIV